MLKNCLRLMQFSCHIHWDHWHGPTLRKFFKGKLLVIGDDSNTRSFDDLRQIGFQNITIVRHGKFIDIGDIRVYFYNFGLLLNDSALVVRTPDIKLLNANDAKLAGASLITLRTFTGSSTLLCVHIHLLTLVFVTPFRATVPLWWTIGSITLEVLNCLWMPSDQNTLFHLRLTTAIFMKRYLI